MTLSLAPRPSLRLPGPCHLASRREDSGHTGESGAIGRWLQRPTPVCVESDVGHWPHPVVTDEEKGPASEGRRAKGTCGSEKGGAHGWLTSGARCPSPGGERKGRPYLSAGRRPLAQSGRATGQLNDLSYCELLLFLTQNSVKRVVKATLQAGGRRPCWQSTCLTCASNPGSCRLTARCPKAAFENMRRGQASGCGSGVRTEGRGTGREQAPAPHPARAKQTASPTRPPPPSLEPPSTAGLHSPPHVVRPGAEKAQIRRGLRKGGEREKCLWQSAQGETY